MKTFKPIIAALIFAALLIASALFLKGSAAKDLAEAILYGVGFYLIFRFTPGIPKKCSFRILRK